ncbi:MAG: Uma2 family endonuclease [Gemmataceae bacterium]
MIAQPRATLDDLYRVEGKAELVNGRIVEIMPTGHRPNLVAGRIYRSLGDYADRAGHGNAYTDGMGFAVPELSSGRESFSPDASYYDGPLPANDMRFVEGPPTFAAEVRSDSDYGPAADTEYADKRTDYFGAGTRVVWDVDPINRTVTCYRAAAPAQPTIFRPGDQADAEPAVPGWRLDVAALFR